MLSLNALLWVKTLILSRGKHTRTTIPVEQEGLDTAMHIWGRTEPRRWCYSKGDNADKVKMWGKVTFTTIWLEMLYLSLRG